MVLGVGASRGCPASELAALVDDALSAAGAVREQVVLVASADVKADEPAILALAAALGVPTRFFPAHELAGVPVPTPSAIVAGHVGTPSVAEAAALLAAGERAPTDPVDAGEGRRGPGTGGPASATDAAPGDRHTTPGDRRAAPGDRLAAPARLVATKRRSAHATCAIATTAPARRSTADVAPARQVPTAPPAPERPDTPNEVPLP
ncbi:unannotated protein [freshwater metagenome]|uniref:Unannotated protein n=1 Tax=freshwater metagenome TaxID=449393 RepID=A0A6J7G1Y9_9ZZZZ